MAPKWYQFKRETQDLVLWLDNIEAKLQSAKVNKDEMKVSLKKLSLETEEPLYSWASQRLFLTMEQTECKIYV